MGCGITLILPSARRRVARATIVVDEPANHSMSRRRQGRAWRSLPVLPRGLRRAAHCLSSFGQMEWLLDHCRPGELPLSGSKLIMSVPLSLVFTRITEQPSRHGNIPVRNSVDYVSARPNRPVENLFRQIHSSRAASTDSTDRRLHLAVGWDLGMPYGTPANEGPAIETVGASRAERSLTARTYHNIRLCNGDEE
jgi:hypothetical protein